MTNSDTIGAGQQAFENLLASVFALDNWAASMRRYVASAKPQPAAHNMYSRQPSGFGLTGAKPGRDDQPRRYLGVL